MARRDARRSSRGLLLVEATLTAVILGLCLVVITRSWSTALRALEQARRTEAALAVAQGKLRELELDGEAGQRFKGARAGQWQAETQAGTASPSRIEWEITVSPYDDAPHDILKPPAVSPALVDQLILTVREQLATGRGGVRVSLTTLVPRAWVPDEWR